MLARDAPFCYTDGMTGAKMDRGFTLIELLVVIMLIGILSAVAMPQYWKTIEKNKANEAIQFFDSLNGSQSRYYAKYNAYCMVAAGCNGFDLTVPPLHYFSAFTLAAPSAGPGWKASLTRTNAPALYGQYVITADVEQNAAPFYTCSQVNCVTDLLPTPLH